MFNDPLFQGYVKNVRGKSGKFSRAIGDALSYAQVSAPAMAVNNLNQTLIRAALYEVPGMGNPWWRRTLGIKSLTGIPQSKSLFDVVTSPFQPGILALSAASIYLFDRHPYQFLGDAMFTEPGDTSNSGIFSRLGISDGLDIHTYKNGKYVKASTADQLSILDITEYMSGRSKYMFGDDPDLAEIVSMIDEDGFFRDEFCDRLKLCGQPDITNIMKYGGATFSSEGGMPEVKIGGVEYEVHMITGFDEEKYNKLVDQGIPAGQARIASMDIFNGEKSGGRMFLARKDKRKVIESTLKNASGFLFNSFFLRLGGMAVAGTGERDANPEATKKKINDLNKVISNVDKEIKARKRMRNNLSSRETSSWITRTYGGDTDPAPEDKKTRLQLLDKDLEALNTKRSNAIRERNKLGVSVLDFNSATRKTALEQNKFIINSLKSQLGEDVANKYENIVNTFLIVVDEIKNSENVNPNVANKKIEMAAGIAEKNINELVLANPKMWNIHKNFLNNSIKFQLDLLKELSNKSNNRNTEMMIDYGEAKKQGVPLEFYARHKVAHEHFFPSKNKNNKQITPPRIQSRASAISNKILSSINKLNVLSKGMSTKDVAIFHALGIIENSPIGIAKIGKKVFDPAELRRVFGTNILIHNLGEDAKGNKIRYYEVPATDAEGKKIPIYKTNENGERIIDRSKGINGYKTVDLYRAMRINTNQDRHIIKPNQINMKNLIAYALAQANAEEKMKNLDSKQTPKQFLSWTNVENSPVESNILLSKTRSKRLLNFLPKGLEISSITGAMLKNENSWNGEQKFDPRIHYIPKDMFLLNVIAKHGTKTGDQDKSEFVNATKDNLTDKEKKLIDKSLMATEKIAVTNLAQINPRAAEVEKSLDQLRSELKKLIPVSNRNAKKLIEQSLKLEFLDIKDDDIGQPGSAGRDDYIDSKARPLRQYETPKFIKRAFNNLTNKQNRKEELSADESKWLELYKTWQKSMNNSLNKQEEINKKVNLRNNITRKNRSTP